MILRLVVIALPLLFVFGANRVIADEEPGHATQTVEWLMDSLKGSEDEKRNVKMYIAGAVDQMLTAANIYDNDRFKCIAEYLKDNTTFTSKQDHIPELVLEYGKRIPFKSMVSAALGVELAIKKHAGCPR
jgi:hypothetical protein